MKGPVIGEQLSDHHVTFVQAWLARHRRVDFADTAVRQALESAARKYSFNPLQDYLRSLVWDGVPRVDKFLATYIGADDTETHLIMGRWWFISAIERAMNPGSKVDHVLVLKGKQGTKKSSAFIALAGHQWGLESVPPLKDKDAMQALRGKWIAVFSELETIRGAALTLVKDYVTRQWDTFRPSYGHYTGDVPRGCVFGGTANETYCLPQDEENRRWWPVQIGAIDTEAIERDRDQIWAEAYHLWANGERWWPESPAHRALLGEAQESSTEQEQWLAPIVAWLSEVCDDQTQNGVSTREVAHRALLIPIDRISQADCTKIGKLLRRLGYVPRQLRLGIPGARDRRYFPPAVTTDTTGHNDT
jgi:predicted P-loop ATPase